MQMLRRIWKKWQEFGRVIGDLIGRLVLTVFYFTILVPFGLLTRLFNDPLALRAGHQAAWTDRHTGDQTLDDAGRQY